MGRKKIQKLFDDEAECSEGESGSSSTSDDDDDDDNDLGGFIVPDGELSDSHYDDSELPEKSTDTAPPAQTPKKRGRPPGKATVAKSNTGSFKPPGDSSYPVNDFSLTVTKTGGDVSSDALDSVAAFIEQQCLKGGVATEVGQRAFNLHLQGIFRMRWPTRKEYVQHLQKIMKGLLPCKGKSYKVLVKPFGNNQEWSAMIGYITKDQGQAHYQIRVHHITRQELSFGRRDHDAMLTSYDDAKKILNFKNLFNECFKFNMRCMHPAVVPIHYNVLYMIQSGSYILSPDFVSCFKKIDLREASILWKMTFTPTETDLEDVLALLFNPLSYGKKASARYFVAGLHRLDIEQEDRLRDDIPTSPSEPISPQGPLGKVNALLEIARSRSSAETSVPTQTQPEYLPLSHDGDDDMCSFTVDRTACAVGTELPAPTCSLRCPPTLDDMLKIVRQLRQERNEALHMTAVNSAIIVTPSTHERQSSSSNSNNFNVTNLTDLMNF